MRSSTSDTSSPRELDHEQRLGIASQRRYRIAQRQVLVCQLQEQAIEQFDRRWAVLQADSEGIHRGGQGGELRHEQADRLRLWHEPQLRLGDESERAFAADNKLVQAGRRLRARIAEGPRDHVEVVAADAAQNARETAGDFRRRRLDRRAHIAINRAQDRAILALPPLRGGVRLKCGTAAIAQDHVEAAHMIDGLAVDDRVRARGVIADHAAEVGPARSGNVGTEHQAVRRQGAVELIENNARLHAGSLARGIDVEDLVEVLAAIDDQPRADRLPRQASAAAARHDRHVHFQGDLHRGMQPGTTVAATPPPAARSGKCSRRCCKACGRLRQSEPRRRRAGAGGQGERHASVR